LYVTGLFLSANIAAQIVQPLDHAVLFLKETDVVLTSDVWRVLLHMSFSTYHDIIAPVNSDLLLINQQKQAFTPTAELKQIKLLLRTLDSRLNYFHQVLPKLNPRRGLVSLGENILDSLFGTATVSDVHLLHDVVSDLQLKNSAIVHLLENQLTYVKSSSSSKINAEGIANLTDFKGPTCTIT
jgi:hypothetical protein